MSSASSIVVCLKSLRNSDAGITADERQGMVRPSPITHDGRRKAEG